MTESRPVKILHMASGDLWAGGEVQLFNLASGLDKLPDTRVSVILLNHGTLEEKLTRVGIEVIVIDENTLGSLAILHKFIQLIRERQPDIIHTQRAKVNILGSIAAYVSGKVPSIRTAHGSQEYPPSWTQFGSRLILFTERLCDNLLQKKIIAVSKNLGEILTGELPAEKISIIENGIDSVELIKNLPVKADTSDDNSTFRVGIAGRLVPIKRVDLFIRIAYYFKQHYPEIDLHFYIFGDGPLRTELEVLSSQLGTNDIVHFEGHCDDMPQKLKMIDVLLMTSEHEGLPMVLLEAMTLETPIVAHSVGGITNLLDQGKCGMLVEEHSAEGYAKALHALLESPEDRQAVVKNALNHVINVYSAEHNAKEHLRLYRKILAP